MQGFVFQRYGFHEPEPEPHERTDMKAPTHRCSIRASLPRRRDLLVGCATLMYLLLWSASPAGAQDRTTKSTDIDSLLQHRVQDENRAAFQVVTASKALQTTREAIASISIVTANDIALYGYETVADILNSVPGFYLTSDRNYMYAGIRGFGRPGDFNNRLLLMYDGHALNERTYGSGLLGTEYPLDPESIDHVEIVRGAQGLYGNNAMLAMVYIVPKTGLALDGITVSGSAGSFGRLRGSVTAGGELFGNMQYTVSGVAGGTRGEDLYFPEFDTPESNRGWATNLDRDRYYGMTASASCGSTSLLAGFTRRDKDVPTAPYDAWFDEPGTWTGDERGYLVLRHAGQLAATVGYSARGYFDYYGYRAGFAYRPDAAENSYDRSAGFEGQISWDLAENNRLSSGLQVDRHYGIQYNYSILEQPLSRYLTTFTLASLFLQDDYQLTENLGLMCGLRYDKYSGMPDAFTPRAGLVYLPTDELSLKALYAEGFRLPSSYELLYDDPTSNFRKNPDLRRERIRTFEGLFEYSPLTGLTFHGSIFYYQMRGLIEETLVDAVDSVSQYINKGDVDAPGIELECAFTASATVKGYLGYAWSHPHWKATDAELSNAPEHAIVGGISCVSEGVGSLSIDGRFETSRHALSGADSDPFFLMNAHFRSSRLLGCAQLTLDARNLLDTDYRLPGAYEHRQDFLPQSRRVLSAGFIVTF
jgi:outer membrane receptor for ferrienterochelin and colicins